MTLTDILTKVGVSTTSDEYEEIKRKYAMAIRERDISNKTVGSYKDGYDCPLCNNRGFNFVVSGEPLNPFVATRQCDCMKIRKSLQYMKKSGLANVVDKYSFHNFNTERDWQKDLKATAEAFTDEQSKWFFVGGRSGCGKTHICTAMCKELMKKGKPMRYMLWMDDVKELKSTVMEPEKHAKLINDYKNVDVLYIDDFFKTGKDSTHNQLPSQAEISLAYEIINHRYLEPKAITVISSERTAQDILKIDEATGGRILERATPKYVKNLFSADVYNYRLKDFM